MTNLKCDSKSLLGGTTGPGSGRELKQWAGSGGWKCRVGGDIIGIDGLTNLLGGALWGKHWVLRLGAGNLWLLSMEFNLGLFG